MGKFSSCNISRALITGKGEFISKSGKQVKRPLNSLKFSKKRISLMQNHLNLASLLRETDSRSITERSEDSIRKYANKYILSMSHQYLNIMSKRNKKTFTGWPLSNVAVSCFVLGVSQMLRFFLEPWPFKVNLPELSAPSSSELTGSWRQCKKKCCQSVKFKLVQLHSL